MGGHGWMPNNRDVSAKLPKREGNKEHTAWMGHGDEIRACLLAASQLP